MFLISRQTHTKLLLLLAHIVSGGFTAKFAQWVRVSYEGMNPKIATRIQKNTALKTENKRNNKDPVQIPLRPSLSPTDQFLWKTVLCVDVVIF